MYTDPIAALVRAYAFRFCADPELLQRACVDHTCRPAFGDDEDDDEESEQTGIEPTKVLIERLLGFALPAKAVSKPTVLSEFLHQQAQACEMPELNETVVGRNLHPPAHHPARGGAIGRR